MEIDQQIIIQWGNLKDELSDCYFKFLRNLEDNLRMYATIRGLDIPFPTEDDKPKEEVLWD